MEVTETKSEGLSRAFNVRIPATVLSEKLDAKIEEIRPQMRLKGFRPGKVPASHVRRMYGKSIMGDIIQEIVTSSSQEALDERELRVAHAHLRLPAPEDAGRLEYAHQLEHAQYAQHAEDLELR